MSGSQDWEAFLSLNVDVQLNEHTRFLPRLYPGDDRVTVALEGSNSVRVTLYLPRADLLRLRDALTAIADDLDTARSANGPGVTNSAA